METNYDDFAESFSRTRLHVWDEVKKFLDGLARYSMVLDAGCGNGKNMVYRDQDLVFIGCDISRMILGCCVEKEIFQADIRSLPLRGKVFDAVLCVAVIHHFRTFRERLDAIKHLLQFLRPNGGRMIITMWADFSSCKNMTRKKVLITGPNDYIVPWGEFQRFYHLMDREEMDRLVEDIRPLVRKISYRISRGNWNLLIVR